MPRFCTKATEIQAKTKHKNQYFGGGNQFMDKTFYLPDGKTMDITDLCKIEKNTTLRELTSLIRKWISTYPAALPAPLYCCLLQMYQITKSRANLSYEDKISLNECKFSL